MPRRSRMISGARMAIASVDGKPQRFLLDHGQRELAGDFSVRCHRCGISGLPRLSLGRRFMSSMHNPAHPGEVLREYLPEGLGVSDAAKRLGVTRQALSALINGRAGVSALHGSAGLRGCGVHRQRLLDANRRQYQRHPLRKRRSRATTWRRAGKPSTPTGPPSPTCR